MNEKHINLNINDKNLYLNILKNDPKNYEAILKLGLIDVIGTFEDAVLIAGTMGQITGKPKTVQVNKKRPSVLDWFTGNLGQTVSGWFDELPAYRWRME